MFDVFGAAKLGRMRVASFLSASQRVFQLVPPVAGEKALYMLYTTANCRVAQGGIESTTDGWTTTTLTASGTTASRLTTGFYFPLYVENVPSESYIAVRGVTANGDLEITRISDVFIGNGTDWSLVTVMA